MKTLTKIQRQFALLTLMALAALLITACGGPETTPGDLTQHAETSECGGFAQLEQPVQDVQPEYCAAELLTWTYAASSSTLQVANTRATLNCCGVHGFSVEEIDGTYVFTETDDPEFGDARCSCMCVFDFSLSVQGISTGVIPIRLERRVSDWPEGSGTIFAGELDLAEGSGFVVLDDEPSMWCEVR